MWVDLVAAWLLVAGAAGLVLLGLWGLTDHSAAGANINLLLFNPVPWIAWLPAARRGVAALLVAGTAIALALALIPGGQYSLDVAALAAPLNLGCAIALWRGARMREAAGAQG